MALTHDEARVLAFHAELRETGLSTIACETTTRSNEEET